VIMRGRIIVTKSVAHKTISYVLALKRTITPGLMRASMVLIMFGVALNLDKQTEGLGVEF
jgi:hypothetical protein